MLNLILVRHGHTIWNDTGGVAGRSDIALSEYGQRAVADLADSWASGAKLDSWYSSPLIRTMQTSQLLRDIIAHKLPLPQLVTDQRLVELDFGDWEGMTWQTVHEQYAKQMQTWGEDWVNRSPPNGETFGQQSARCIEWMQTIQHQPDSTHNAMVVSHGGSIRALLCHCMGWPLTQAMDFQIDPASVTIIEQTDKGGVWTLRKLNSQTF